MKKTLSLLLVCCILFSMLPAMGLSAWAGTGVEATLYRCGFETEEEFAQWTMEDRDGQKNGWIRTIGSAISPEGKYFLSSFSYIPENDSLMEEHFGDNVGIQSNNNWAISPELLLPNSTGIYFDCTLFARNPGGPYEGYQIFLQPEEGERVLLASGTLQNGEDYRNPKLMHMDLSSYAGQKVQLIVVHFGRATDAQADYRYALCLDDVHVWYYDDRTEVDAVGVHVDAPETGKAVMEEAEIPTYYEGSYVADVSWEPAHSVFRPDTQYTVTLTCEAEQGYRFADNIEVFINEKVATRLSADADSCKFSYTFPATEARPENISVNYAYDSKTVRVGDSLTLEALYDLPADITDVKFCWYAAEAPGWWGHIVEGSDSPTLKVDTSEAGVRYYHCYISGELNGYTVTSSNTEFKTICVTVQEALPAHLNVSYNIKETEIFVGESVELQAICQLPEKAKNVIYQWYVSESPNQWGEKIVGETTDTYVFCGGMEETLYFRCQVCCTVDGVEIGSRADEFETVKVKVVPAPLLPAMNFRDVKSSDWFYKDVEFVYHNGLMNGTAPDLFSPQLATTRGMIVTVLYRMEGEPAVSGECPFNDVASGSYYEDPIAWAAENSIVNGIGNGKYAPDDKITREQLAAIFYRFAQYKGMDVEENYAPLTGFADSGKVSSWAVDAMSWAVGVGLIGGSNEATGLYLNPQGNALRCQVAAILHRWCQQ